MTLPAINLASAWAISAKDKITTIVNRRRKESRREVKETMDKLRGKELAEVGLQVRFGKPVMKVKRKHRARIEKRRGE